MHGALNERLAQGASVVCGRDLEHLVAYEFEGRPGWGAKSSELTDYCVYVLLNPEGEIYIRHTENVDRRRWSPALTLPRFGKRLLSD